MSQLKGTHTFGEFYQIVYNAATVEPLATRFREWTQIGDRRAMVEGLITLPCVIQSTVMTSYRGKNDELAVMLFEKIRQIKEQTDDPKKNNKVWKMMDQALFAANANSKVFLDLLLQRANFSYQCGFFKNSLKDCQCMLAIPKNFYDYSLESASHFVECTNHCLTLKSKCIESLESSVRYRQNPQGLASEKKEIAGNEGKIARKNNGFRQNNRESDDDKLPSVHANRHTFLRSCSDAVDLQINEQKGRQLVARKDIAAGTVLIVDRPYALSTDEDALKRNCLHCHTTLGTENTFRIPCRNCQTVSFCSENCREEAWRMYHELECAIFNHFFKVEERQHHRQSSHLLLAYRTTILKLLDMYGTRNSEKTAKTILKTYLDNNFLDHSSMEITDDSKVPDDFHFRTLSLDFEKENCKKSSVGEIHSSDLKKEIVSRKGSNGLGTKTVYDPLDYRTVEELETHCTESKPSINLLRSIEAIFLAKCLLFCLEVREDDPLKNQKLITIGADMLRHLQAINCNAYEVSENVWNESTHVWEPRNVGGAIYTTVSLVNHACYPNVVRHSYPQGMVVVRASRSIKKGSEILDCYGPHFLSENKAARQEYLWKKYHFICSCDACAHNWQLPVPEFVGYKCESCVSPNYTKIQTNDTVEKIRTCCTSCGKKINCKKLEKDFRKYVEKREKAASKMYNGNYEEALPLLLDHERFVDRHLAAPNMEAIKTQQCIVQCYNPFSCTAK